MYWSNASPAGSPSGSQHFMPRSQSSATLSSTDSNSLEAASVRQQYQHPNRSESDLVNGMSNSVSDVSSAVSGMHGRQRSRSSPRPQLDPNVAQPGTADPASGRAARTTVSGLQRQNSYHGIASPSPQRSSGLSRAQSSASNKRQGKPASLAASAFGLTPVQPEGGYSPVPSPSTASSNRTNQSDMQGMQPFTHSMSGMAISPETMSSSGTSSSQSAGGAPSHGQPITPMQPNGFSTSAPNGHAPPPGVQYYHVAMPDGHGHPHPPPPQHYTYVYAHPGYAPYPTPVEAKQPVSWREE